MKPEQENYCLLCLNQLKDSDKFHQLTRDVNFCMELDLLFGKWLDQAEQFDLCCRCTAMMQVYLKNKLDLLWVIFKSYSFDELESYLDTLTSILKNNATRSASVSMLVGQTICNGENSSKTKCANSNEMCIDEPMIEYPVSLTSSQQPAEKMNKIFHCGICSYHSMSRSELQKHNQQHKLGNRYVCKTCGNTFKRKYSCIFHQSVHSDIRPFTCSYCGRGFNWQALLRKHERLHTGEKPYKCNVCNQQFRLLEQLHKHKKCHITGEPDKSDADSREVCEKCGKMYSSHEALYRHLKTHDRKHQCQLCDFSTNIDEEYSKHLVLHSKARKHHCLICQKAFIRREHLTRHLRIHTGETPYHCSVCSKGFAQSQDLKKHERTHTGEKPFHCSSCCRSFTSKVSLKRHKCITTDPKTLKIESASNLSIVDEVSPVTSQTSSDSSKISGANQIPSKLVVHCVNVDNSLPSLETRLIGHYEESQFSTAQQPEDHVSSVPTSTLGIPVIPPCSSINQTFITPDNAAGSHVYLPSLCCPILSLSSSQMPIITAVSDLGIDATSSLNDIAQQNLLAIELQNLKTCTNDGEYLVQDSSK